MYDMLPSVRDLKEMHEIPDKTIIGRLFSFLDRFGILVALAIESPFVLFKFLTNIQFLMSYK